MSSHITCAQRLYLTADKAALVGHGDARAAFLYASPGDLIPIAEHERFGLVDGALPDFDAAAAAEAEAAERAAAEKAAAEAAAKEAAEKTAAESKEKASAETKPAPGTETKPAGPAKRKPAAKPANKARA